MCGLRVRLVQARNIQAMQSPLTRLSGILG
jgi:hypothetical protein